MDVQAIFNKVIVSGQYEEATWFMCSALAPCLRSNIINQAEFLAAKGEIEHYLGEYHTLGRALKQSHLPYSPKDKLEIYKDWANRPKLY